MWREPAPERSRRAPRKRRQMLRVPHPKPRSLPLRVGILTLLPRTRQNGPPFSTATSYRPDSPNGFNTPNPNPLANAIKQSSAHSPRSLQSVIHFELFFFLFMSPDPFPIPLSFLFCHSDFVVVLSFRLLASSFRLFALSFRAKSRNLLFPAPIPTIPDLKFSVKVIRHILSLRKTPRFCGKPRHGDARVGRTLLSVAFDSQSVSRRTKSREVSAEVRTGCE